MLYHGLSKCFDRLFIIVIHTFIVYYEVSNICNTMISSPYTQYPCTQVAFIIVHICKSKWE